MAGTDLFITLSGEFGTFSWEMPPMAEKIFTQLEEICPGHHDGGEEKCADQLKKDVAQLVESFVRLLASTLMWPPAASDCLTNLNAGVRTMGLVHQTILLHHASPNFPKDPTDLADPD